MSRKRHPCTNSWEEHYEMLQEGFMLSGVGGGCPEVYQGLVEIAEMLRRVHGWEVHVPDEKRVGREVKRALEVKAEMERNGELEEIIKH